MSASLVGSEMCIRDRPLPAPEFERERATRRSCRRTGQSKPELQSRQSAGAIKPEPRSVDSADVSVRRRN
eukprot:1250898-Alexandrium_andersonii.AAC.1